VSGEPVISEPKWGISTLSVASAREKPEHMAEMGTQVLLGYPVELLQQKANWFLVRSQDGYQAWLEDGTFVRRTRAEVESWQHGPLAIVTVHETILREKPERNAAPVCDVVLGDLLTTISKQDDWAQAGLPDGRSGWLLTTEIESYDTWLKSRKPAPENIEATARSLMGRPYLWGGNSPKGLDCSGFTQLVFRMNGVELKRNSREQSKEGVDIAIDPEFKKLRKGDLLFFGRRASEKGPERVIHVGIYLQDKLFIHSSERVQINSLDPNSPIRDEHRIRTLVRARRML
jgi:SH3-like domain-containing protein